MLSKTMEDALNEQINKELYSAYLYLSMAAYCESVSLPGFAHWMRAQAQEEQEHAMKLYDFVFEQGGRVVLKAIDAPPVEFESPMAVFSSTLEHEQKVTAFIDALYSLAVEEKDHASQVHLQWFISEQVEEEKSASQILERLNLVDDKAQSLVMVDRHLASR